MVVCVLLEIFVETGDTRVFVWFLPELFDVAVEQMVIYLPRVSVWTGVCS